MAKLKLGDRLEVDKEYVNHRHYGNTGVVVKVFSDEDTLRLGIAWDGHSGGIYIAHGESPALNFIGECLLEEGLVHSHILVRKWAVEKHKQLQAIHSPFGE